MMDLCILQLIILALKTLMVYFYSLIVVLLQFVSLCHPLQYFYLFLPGFVLESVEVSVFLEVLYLFFI